MSLEGYIAIIITYIGVATPIILQIFKKDSDKKEKTDSRVNKLLIAFLVFATIGVVVANWTFFHPTNTDSFSDISEKDTISENDVELNDQDENTSIEDDEERNSSKENSSKENSSKENSSKENSSKENSSKEDTTLVPEASFKKWKCKNATEEDMVLIVNWLIQTLQEDNDVLFTNNKMIDQGMQSFFYDDDGYNCNSLDDLYRVVKGSILNDQNYNNAGNYNISVMKGPDDHTPEKKYYIMVSMEYINK